MNNNINQHEKWKYLGKPECPWTQTPQEYEKIRRLEDSHRPQGFAVSDQEKYLGEEETAYLRILLNSLQRT